MSGWAPGPWKWDDAVWDDVASTIKARDARLFEDEA